MTSTASGILISRWGRYKIFPVVGTAFMTAGMYLLSHLAVGTTTLASSVYMFVLGVGIGGVMQVLVIAVQNIVDYKDLGVATSAATFFRSIGGSFGTAVFGAIFTSQLAGNLRRDLAGTPVPVGFNPKAGASPAVLAKLPAAAHAGYIHAFATSLHTVFLIATPITAVAFALTWLLKEVPLRQAAANPDPAQTLAPSAMPSVRNSADEITRALSTLANREDRARVYTALAKTAEVDLDPRSTWLLLGLEGRDRLDLAAAAANLGVTVDHLDPLLAPLSHAGYLTFTAATGVGIGPAGGSGGPTPNRVGSATVTPAGLGAIERLVVADGTG